MTRKQGAFLAFLFAMAIAPHAADAMGAGAGCADLPEYDRAVGALEGMPGACDMSVEQARRIVAAEQARQQPAQPSSSAMPRHHHRHRRTSAHMN